MKMFQSKISQKVDKMQEKKGFVLMAKTTGKSLFQILSLKFYHYLNCLENILKWILTKRIHSEGSKLISFNDHNKFNVIVRLHYQSKVAL